MHCALRQPVASIDSNTPYFIRFSGSQPGKAYDSVSFDQSKNLTSMVIMGSFAPVASLG
jgi:hypothetical protein